MHTNDMCRAASIPPVDMSLEKGLLVHQYSKLRSDHKVDNSISRRKKKKKNKIGDRSCCSQTLCAVLRGSHPCVRRFDVNRR
jgi:hypothetical protein